MARMSQAKDLAALSLHSPLAQVGAGAVGCSHVGQSLPSVDLGESDAQLEQDGTTPAKKKHCGVDISALMEKMQVEIARDNKVLMERNAEKMQVSMEGLRCVDVG